MDARIIKTLFLLIFAFPFSVLAQKTCNGEQYNFFEPIVGSWEKYDITGDNKKHIGTLVTQMSDHGCTLRQYFTSADQSLTFQSLAYPHRDGYWREYYLFSDHREVPFYKWSTTADTLIIEHIQTKTTPQRRWVIFDLSGDSYFVSDEESHDGGLNWQRRELVHTIRK